MNDSQDRQPIDAHRRVFGEFELTTRPAALTRQGVPVSLSSQPLRLLALMVERRGEILTHEAIHDAFWPDQAVDATARIHAAVRQIRKALDDNGDSPRFVETVPRQGYRFVAAVAEPGAAVEKPSSRLLAGGAALAVLLATALIFAGERMSSDGETREHSAPVPAASFVDARRLLEAGTPASLQDAISLLRGVLRDDPGFAPAHASLSQAMLAAGDANMARSHANNAIALDPTYAVGHLRRAEIEAYLDWDWAAARASLQRAVELTPDSAEVALPLAHISLLGGDAAAADRWLSRALSVKPLNAGQLTKAADILYLQRQYSEAASLCAQARLQAPAYGPALDCLYRSALGARDFDRAAEAVLDLASVLGADERTVARFRATPGVDRVFEFEAWYLEDPELALRQSDPVRAAIASAALRRYDEAMFLLREALAARSPGLPAAMIDPSLVALHHQTAFIDMRRHIGVVSDED